MSQATHTRFGLFNTEERIIHSSVIDQDFRIGIWLPFSYTGSDQKYTVLYVPDAEFAFSMAAGLIPTLIGSQEVPEMMVVGIAYHNLSGWGEFGALRDRDLCAPGFQKPPDTSRIYEYTEFYKQELFPLIETEYRGSPENRALYGFSSGGFFTLHTMLTQPGMFRRHIAASCTWPGADEFFLNREKEYAAQPMHPPTDLYLAVGGLEEEQLPGFQKVTKAIKDRNYPGFRLFTQVMDGEIHGSGMIAKTFLYGLKATFKP